ncbi:MAG: DUF4167 domain-containing protein [Alphaproteobacteria bacterium]
MRRKTNKSSQQKYNHAPNRQHRSGGNPKEQHKKYVSRAKDAISAGNRVEAESYLQFAEHYFRISQPQPAD